MHLLTNSILPAVFRAIGLMAVSCDSILEKHHLGEALDGGGKTYDGDKQSFSGVTKHGIHGDIFWTLESDAPGRNTQCGFNISSKTDIKRADSQVHRGLSAKLVFTGRL